MTLHRFSNLGFALVALGLAFGATPDFSGNWEFAPGKSTNVGMMAMMKIKAKVRQTDDTLVVTSVAVFNGTEQTTENRFDLTGKPVENRTPMNAKAETVSHWQGAHLVTTWTTGGPTDSEKQTRTETRYLSSDGKTMTVETTRDNAPTIILVYERK
jgi:hypothetical protein